MKLADGKVTLHAGDCLEVLATLAENSIDAIVTDPPYELGFMGKSWDASGVAFCPDTWRLAWRVLKPGGHLVAFGAPKNYHRLACAIEDAGFEIRDSLMWVFGSGFPKSLNVAKQIDVNERFGKSRPEDVRRAAMGGDYAPSGRGRVNYDHGGGSAMNGVSDDALHSDTAREWQGWGTALKPAYEPIVLARKPLSEGTVAANVLRWGTGALNIDATRIETNPAVDDPRLGGKGAWKTDKAAKNVYEGGYAGKEIASSSLGRWPANLCHDGSQGVLDLFPYTKSGSLNPEMNIKTSTGWAGGSQSNRVKNTFNSNEGSAARFFYCAKASKQDRADSKHPTVKPINLMRWLVRMVTPPGGTVLDPFAGSGTTGLAATLEGYEVQLIEREPEYQADIRSRFND